MQIECESHENGKLRFMSDEEFINLSSLIHRELGILIRGERKYTLHTKLAHRLAILGVKSYTDYIDLVSNSEEEFTILTTEITNNETFFQREKNQYTAFSNFLPAMKRRLQSMGKNRVSVLSCGCSTGEELYNLCIILMESGHFAWNWELSLTGIDVDKTAIKKAKKGIYGTNSFRLMKEDEEFMKKHFYADEKGHRIRSIYKNTVRFRHGNLMCQSSFDGLEELDAIFCRNVFIYMSDEAIARIARNFHSCLHDEGYLFIGSSESLIGKTDLFAPEYRDGIVVYRKR